jgi:hypothetical protein
MNRRAFIGLLGGAAAWPLAARVGLVEKRDFLTEYRWADYHYERLPALAAELVSRPVDLIFAAGSVVSAIAQQSRMPVNFPPQE